MEIIIIAMWLCVILPTQVDPVRLSDLDRFPQRPVVIWVMDWYTTQGEWMEKRLEECKRGSETYQFYINWRKADYQRWGVWDSLSDAQKHPNEGWRIESLKLLRLKIGDNAYFTGTMPPVVMEEYLPYYHWRK